MSVGLGLDGLRPRRMQVLVWSPSSSESACSIDLADKFSVISNYFWLS